MTTSQAQHAIVYCARNLLNGDEYIGATEKTLGTRKTRHLWNATRHPHTKFHRALVKYGADSFSWSVVTICTDFFAALEVERTVIAERSPAYNLTAGGGGIKGYRHTSENKAKMSEAKKGKPGIWARTKMPNEIRERLAACRRAERGRILGESHKAAMRINAGRANEFRRKPVVELSTGKTYKSVTEAAAVHALTGVTVSKLCKTQVPSRYGLSFRYGVKNVQ